MGIHNAQTVERIISDGWNMNDLGYQGDMHVSHREITPTGLSGPRFHVPLHNFTPTPGPAGGPVCTTGPNSSSCA